jgi:hypothetical protein
VGRDFHLPATLEKSDRSELFALSPDRVGPTPHDPLDVVGPGVGGEIKVVFGAQPSEDGVAHHSADQVKAKTGLLEAGRDVANLIDETAKTVRNH